MAQVINLKLNRQGKNLSAQCAVSGGFSLTAMLLFFASFTGDGRELLAVIVKLLITALK
jgi:hypothetical protein